MTPFERWSVWLASGLTTLTGLVYAWMKYVPGPADPWAVVGHPWQPAVLKLHILAAPSLVFAVGLIALRHVWPHVRGITRTGRRSGMTVVLVVLPMVLTGYLIQAVTGEGWLLALGYGHFALGVVYAVGLALHRLMVGRAVAKATPRRERRRADRRADAERV